MAMVEFSGVEYALSPLQLTIGVTFSISVKGTLPPTNTFPVIEDL